MGLGIGLGIGGVLSLIGGAFLYLRRRKRSAQAGIYPYVAVKAELPDKASPASLAEADSHPVSELPALEHNRPILGNHQF